MIVAAGSAGRYGEPPPPLLQQAWQIKRWGALPEAGGLRDQPAGLLARMAILLDIYTANKAYADALQANGGDGMRSWEQRNQDIVKVARETMLLRDRLKREADCGE